MCATLQTSTPKNALYKARMEAVQITYEARTEGVLKWLVRGSEKGLRRSLSHGVVSFITLCLRLCRCCRIALTCNGTLLTDFAYET